MTVLQLRPRNAAESALIELAEAGAPDGDSRRQAIDALRRDGLPSRRVEAWHYTDLRGLLGRRDRAVETAIDSSRGVELLPPLLPNGGIVELGSGEWSGSPLGGVTVEQTGALAQWQRSPNHLDREIDTIRVLNAAFGAAEVRVTVEDDAALAAPIELRSGTGPSGSQSLARCIVGRGAKAIFVEHLSGGGNAVLSTGVSTLEIGQEADVIWIVDQAKGRGETHLGQLNVSVGANARFTLFVLNAGGTLVRYEVHAVTAGEGAEIKIRGVNLLEDNQHIDVTTTLHHTVPHTTATETFRNVVMGGHGVFQGMIKVAKDAQKTDAKMACNSLLLSDDGDFSAKPELEIFADDVQCGHGATAGEIDANHLFYLMSRGIPEREARALLVKAFVAEVVEELEYPAAEEALLTRIDAWLSADR